MDRNLAIARPICAVVALGLLAVVPAAAGFSFSDAAPQAGLDFVRASITGTEQNFPETNGSGACWGDVDGDGVDDLFLVNGLYSDDALTEAIDPHSSLYVNHGDGVFTDVTLRWGADLRGWGQGCSFADYDGDADLDLLVAGYDMLHLMRNDGDTFTDVTETSDLTLEGKCDGNTYCFAETGSWGDYDGDGDLDLYITQYADYDIDEGGPVSPGLYNGMSNIMWQNDGDGTFTDVTDAAGVRDDPGPARSKSFQSIWADYDRDGDPDIYVASDTTPNTLFRNNGDGTFTDVAIIAGVDDSGASMGLIFQDMNHDGLPDLYFTHYQGEHNGYYLNNGDGTFAFKSGEDGLDTDLDEVGWGTASHDFDNDGDTDLIVVNGHTTPDLDHEQEPILYRANGDGTYTDVSTDAGSAFANKSVARGMAVADHDLDGDLDFILAEQYNDTVRLVRNDAAPGNFIQFAVRESTGMNRYAVHAEVTITPAGGTPLMRTIQSGNNFLSQDSQVIHAGLGTATTADVSVKWADGTVQSWTGLDAGVRLTATKGLSALADDLMSPMTTFDVTGSGIVGGWYNGPVTVALSSIDRGIGVDNGVTSIEIDTGDGNGFVPYTGAVTYATTGEHVVRARATDGVGNVEPVRYLDIGIDRTPPVTTLDTDKEPVHDDWYLDRVHIDLTATDAEAGVHETYYRVNGGAWQTGTSFNIIESGVHTVEFYSEDRAGNMEPVQSQEIKVDGDLPNVVISHGAIYGGYGSALIDAAAWDDTSAIYEVRFYVDEETTPRGIDRNGSDSYTFLFEDAPGIYTVRAEASDMVGHTISDEIHVVLLVDTSASPLQPPAWPLIIPLVALPGLRRPRP